MNFKGWALENNSVQLALLTIIGFDVISDSKSLIFLTPGGLKKSRKLQLRDL